MDQLSVGKVTGMLRLVIQANRTPLRASRLLSPTTLPTLLLTPTTGRIRSNT